jgi:hypothetical protein
MVYISNFFLPASGFLQAMGDDSFLQALSKKNKKISKVEVLILL